MLIINGVPRDVPKKSGKKAVRSRVQVKPKDAPKNCKLTAMIVMVLFTAACRKHPADPAPTDRPAVKAALVQRYAIAPDRLTTDGFGASQPQEKNNTPEGRARNRRVELIRQ